MKKIAVKVRKYINCISVLVTVFAVFVTASFYNPASLASTSQEFIWRVVSPAISGSWVVWNPEELAFSEYVYGGSSRGVYSSSGSFSSPNTAPNQIMVNYDFSIPFFLWPLSDREPGSVFTVDGRFNLTVLVRLNSSFGNGTVFCNPVTFNGILPDGVSISYFQTSGSFNLNSADLATISIQIVFDNVELGSTRDHLSFTVDFSGSCLSSSDKTNNVAPDLAYQFTVSDAFLSVRSGYAQGSDRDIVDGYDSSAGNASQSKLDTSLSGQEAKEDSLFTSASDNLSKFTLTDLSSMPKVVAGLAFVSSTMTSIFESLGGVNGAGIVLSVGCSILFVSFCIGAYKFYSGRKD